MAVVIPIEKLVRGLTEIMTVESVYVRLKNTNTVYRDKVTGWTIVGKEIKELPEVSPGRSSQTMLAAIRAGRFERVIKAKGSIGRKRKKYEELVDSIMAEYESMLSSGGEDDENES